MRKAWFLAVAVLAVSGFLAGPAFAEKMGSRRNSDVSTTAAPTASMATIGKMDPKAIKAASSLNPKAIAAIKKMDAKTLTTVSNLSKTGGLKALTDNAKSIQAMSAAKAARANKAVTPATKNTVY